MSARVLHITRALAFTAYFGDAADAGEQHPPSSAAAMVMLWLSAPPLVSGLVAEMFGTPLHFSSSSGSPL